VIVRTQADPRFTRAGADLWHDLHIQAPDAALGTTVAVPAPEGPAQVSSPAGTQPGTVLQIAGKGLPRQRGHGRGSLNVTVIVDIPEELSPGSVRGTSDLRRRCEAFGPCPARPGRA
jgi:DnaJ-class molecular chaperone